MSTFRVAWAALWNRIECRRDPIGFARSRGVTVGEGCELIAISPGTFGSEPYLVTIGDGVTISHDVDFITHDGGLRVVRREEPGAHYFAPIVVEDRVFVGAGARILAGVTIGAGSVIGASSLVSRDIPPGVVAAGVPARVLKTVAEYADGRRPNYTNTSGLTAAEKERVLRAKFGR